MLIKALLVATLAVEGFMLLRPDGTLVHAAQPPDYQITQEAVSWWRHSRVHMGCSIPSCKRPATRTASYRSMSSRGATWRAYGFCDLHNPPAEGEGLVYRMGHPPAFSYDVPLTPVWTEIYFLTGAFGFAIWCVCVWRLAAAATRRRYLALGLMHASALVLLWLN